MCTNIQLYAGTKMLGTMYLYRIFIREVARLVRDHLSYDLTYCQLQD